MFKTYSNPTPKSMKHWIKSYSCSFDSTYNKTETIQRRLARLPAQDDTQIHETFHIFKKTNNKKSSSYYPKQSTYLMQSLTKFQSHFHKNRRDNPKTCIEPHKTLKSQSNLEKEQRWKQHAPWFKTVWQSYNNQTVY